jgi:hypothetical protein
LTKATVLFGEVLGFCFKIDAILKIVLILPIKNENILPLDF